MMAPSIIYCAPIPFNIVFHNANKGKMRINVLDLSRFCYALGRERTTPGNSLALLRSFPIIAVTTTKTLRRDATWRIRYFVNFDASENNSCKCTLYFNHNIFSKTFQLSQVFYIVYLSDIFI